jgi:hypothetical protein
MWVNGTPVRQVYNPVLHVSVALLARWTHWTAAHSYHFSTALAYCLGPVTLFWLCWRATRRPAFSLLAGTIYSLISPSTFLIPALRHDVGGLLLPKRFQTLVLYGEGPHITGLMMLPLVIWALDEAAAGRKRLFIFLAPIALATLVLTNWTGTTGLSFAIAAYCLSKLGAARPGGRSIHWPILLAVGAIAYMLASPWIPPSLIRTVQESAENMDAATSWGEKFLVLLSLALAVLALHVTFERYETGSWVRFFAYFGLISGVVAGGKLWLGLSLVPIGHRFHLEMEMAIAGVVAYAVARAWEVLPRRARAAAAVALIAACAIQARTYRRYAQGVSQPIDFAATAEYKMAQWFAGNIKGERVFGPERSPIG